MVRIFSLSGPSANSTAQKHCCQPVSLLQQWDWRELHTQSRKHQCPDIQQAPLINQMGTD